MNHLFNAWERSFIFIGLLSLAAGGCAPLEPTPLEPPRPPQVLRPPLEFRTVKGAEEAMREATIFIEKLPSIGARLEIRTVSVQPRENAVLPTEHEVALEVRSGELVTVTNGDRQERHPGDMWLVAPGSRVTLSVLGQRAVLRAIYLIRETR